MQAITERPGDRVIAVEPPASPETGAESRRLARGAMIGTVLALFPWSLVILLVGWLIR
jgi:hypothetical protein